jgi:hyperosmotically inducible protein
MLRTILGKPLILTMLLLGLVGTAFGSLPANQETTLAEQVRHQILMLPYYNVFDNIGFTIRNNNTVVLTGVVTQPVVKYDAAAAVRSVKGVEKVVNNIEVLPLSPFDNSIRRATYRAIFSRPGFWKYADQVQPPIRIIVKNGHVTLDGYVDSKLDRTMADLAAKSVPNVFSVTDNLKVG